MPSSRAEITQQTAEMDVDFCRKCRMSLLRFRVKLRQLGDQGQRRRCLGVALAALSYEFQIIHAWEAYGERVALGFVGSI
jgi:hypothetical protein